MDSCVSRLPAWRNSTGRVFLDVQNFSRQVFEPGGPEAKLISVISRNLFSSLFILDGAPADAP